MMFVSSDVVIKFNNNKTLHQGSKELFLLHQFIHPSVTFVFLPDDDHDGDHWCYMCWSCLL